MRTRAEVRRLRIALEIIEASSSHKEAVLIARVALEPTTAAVYHGPTLLRRLLGWRWRSRGVTSSFQRGLESVPDLCVGRPPRPPGADVIMSRPIEANPADTPIDAPPAMRPDSPSAP